MDKDNLGRTLERGDRSFCFPNPITNVCAFCILVIKLKSLVNQVQVLVLGWASSLRGDGGLSPWPGSGPLAVGGFVISFNNLATHRPTLGHISLFAALTHSWSRIKIKDKAQKGIISQRTWVFIDMSHQVQTFCWPLHPPVSWLSLIRAAKHSCVGWELHKVPQCKSSLLTYSISWILRCTLFFHIVTSLELGLVLQSMACHRLINRSLY